MKEKLLYIIWGCMAVLCIGLGTLEATQLQIRIPLIAISVMFFVPGAILLYDAYEANNRKGILRIRGICIVSLSLTLVVMIAFILTAAQGAKVADYLYDVLMLVSFPMVCGQYWILSLFLWGCLLSASFLKKEKAINTDQM